MNKVLYVVPNIDKVSGGPRTRISMFKSEFERHDDYVIMSKNKFWKCLKLRNINGVYVESATNRISIVDLFALLYLKIKTKRVIVFIRDIYIELFPNEYTTPRKRITKYLNIASNFFLILIASKVMFPTKEMGLIFFKKRNYYPKRPFFALPPGANKNFSEINVPNFNQKLGILYLGGISYSNSGFNHFIQFADFFKDEYRFFVLSGDLAAKEIIGEREHIVLSCLPYDKIPGFIKTHNILAAFHTRPRNHYDDITFPIKVLDFISIRLPFITADHYPLQNLLSKEYVLFQNVDDYQGIHAKLRKISSRIPYLDVVDYLGNIATKNTYEERYKELFGKD